MTTELLEHVLKISLLGIGATLFMDGWALLLRLSFGIKGLEYRFVGRWIGHIPNGKIIHTKIDNSSEIFGELALGWLAHYLIGVSFAALLIGIYGLEWLESPTLIPALALGIITTLAPFTILQPGLGAGLFARKTAEPNLSRLKSLMAHTSYGIGLYVSALVLRLIY